MKVKYPLFVAICAILLSGLAISLMAVFIKFADERKLSAMVIIFWRSFWALLIIVPFMLFQKKGQFKPRNFGLILIRSLAGFLGVFFFIYSLAQLNLAIVLALFCTSTLFISLIAYIWKQIPFKAIPWIGLGVGFLGILFVIKPGHVLFNPNVLLALLSGVFISIGQFTSGLASKEDTLEKVNFYYFLITGLLGLIFTGFSFQRDWIQITVTDLLILFFISLFGLLYIYLRLYALKHAPSGLLAGFLYSAVFFALMWDCFIWRKGTDPLSLLGGGLILAGIWLNYIIYRKRIT